MYRRFLFWLPFLGLLVACAAQEQQRHFDETAFAFERAIRWQTLDDAAAFQKEPETIPPRQRERMKHIRLTGYDVIRSTAVDPNHVRQVVEIRYYNENRGVEKAITYEPEWEFDAEKKRWFLVSPLPAFE